MGEGPPVGSCWWGGRESTDGGGGPRPARLTCICPGSWEGGKKYPYKSRAVPCFQMGKLRPKEKGLMLDISIR